MDEFKTDESVRDGDWDSKIILRDDVDFHEFIVRSPLWFANIAINKEEFHELPALELGTFIKERTIQHVVDTILSDPKIEKELNRRLDAAFRKGQFDLEESRTNEFYQIMRTDTLPNGWFTREELNLIQDLLSLHGRPTGYPKLYSEIMKKLQRILSVRTEYYEI